MTKKNFSVEQFEKDSLAVFEKLLQGYRKTRQSKIWETEMDELIDRLTILPNDPFTVELMKMFDYDYLVLSNDIREIIDKALIIRNQMEHMKRFVTIDKTFFKIPFITSNTHLKSMEVFNSEGVLCYKVEGNIEINYRNILRKLNPFFRETKKGKIISIILKTHQLINLEIFHYSPFVDCLSTDIEDYYDFFCDYYGKVQFVQFYHNKETDNDSKEVSHRVNSNDIFDLSTLTDAQQILWAYFFLSL